MTTKSNPSSGLFSFLVLGLLGVAIGIAVAGGPGKGRPLVSMAVSTAVLLVALAAWIVWLRLRFQFSLEGRSLKLAEREGLDAAILDIRQTIDAGPEDGAAWNVLGLLLMFQQKWDEALIAYQNATKFGAKHPMLVHNIGIALWRSGQAAAALPILKAEYEGRPQDLLVGCNYFQLLVASGHNEQARHLWPEFANRFRKNIVVGPSSLRNRYRKTLEETRAMVQGETDAEA